MWISDCLLSSRRDVTSFFSVFRPCRLLPYSRSHFFTRRLSTFHHLQTDLIGRPGSGATLKTLLYGHGPWLYNDAIEVVLFMSDGPLPSLIITRVTFDPNCALERKPSVLRFVKMPESQVHKLTKYSINSLNELDWFWYQPALVLYKFSEQTRRHNRFPFLSTCGTQTRQANCFLSVFICVKLNFQNNAVYNSEPHHQCHRSVGWQGSSSSTMQMEKWKCCDKNCQGQVGGSPVAQAYVRMMGSSCTMTSRRKVLDCRYYCKEDHLTSWNGTVVRLLDGETTMQNTSLILRVK